MPGVRTDLLSDVITTLAPYGLNLIGTTTRAAYESLVPAKYGVTPLLPHAKTIIVIGNGGGTFWTGFRAYTKAHPSHMQQHSHPLDAYTHMITEETLTPLLQGSGAAYRYLYPFRFWSEPVSFMHLAQAAGLAGSSILGIMIHPVYGPWMALRAAVLLDQELYHPPPAEDFDPCLSCVEKPCIQACPAGVISAENGWDIPGCVQHRLTATQDCMDYCYARYNCVYGREHHYPLDELRYHQAQSLATMQQYGEKND